MQEILAHSRNHIRTAGASIVTRRPSIDIDEPITLRAGQQKTVDYRYDVGIPPANATRMEWYENQADADIGEDMYTEYEIATSISPQSPVPNSNDRAQTGTVTMLAPAEISSELTLIGKIIIYYL